MRLVTTTLADYLLPTVSEVPPIKVELVEFPSTKNPMKGIGEAGTVPAAGVIVSGIDDALHDCGITIAEIPITPARLAELIRASSAARK
jgi:aerobic carbon-monoxide dehydrogenase large subunit